MRARWKHNHHDADCMFAWFPTTYGVIAARPSGVMLDKIKSTYTSSHSAKICSLGRSKNLCPMFLSSSNGSARTEVRRNKMRSVSRDKETTHPDGEMILSTINMPRSTGCRTEKLLSKGCKPVSPREIGELLEMSTCLHRSHVCRNTTNKEKHMIERERLSANEWRTKSAS